MGDPAALARPRPPPAPAPPRLPTWVLPKDVTGVLQHLVVLLPLHQALAVVEDEGVDHLFQLQPLCLPGLLLPVEEGLLLAQAAP